MIYGGKDQNGQEQESWDKGTVSGRRDEPDHQDALHRALAEGNTGGFIGRSIKCYLPRLLRVVLCNKAFSFPQSPAHIVRL